MKIGLIAINAKYIHSNLPLRYLRQRFFKPSQIYFFEFSINQTIEEVYQTLILENLDVVFVSLYIWNGAFVDKLMSAFKAVKPSLKVFIGGPEAECLQNYSATYPWADVLLKGHIDALDTYEKFEEVLSAESGIVDLGHGDMDQLPFPYNDFELAEKGLFYYESERGCPFRCTFCMASEQHRIERRSLRLVYSDLKRFIDSDVKQVKWIDRTFNASKERAHAIIAYLIESKSQTNFHFELAPQLIDEAFVQLVSSAPEGLLQFEIGLQSYNPKTLKAIRRSTQLEASITGIRHLLDSSKSHVHVDLIAGLPYETFSSFAAGFNQLMDLKPHMVQLGFLKVLKGTALYNQREAFGYIHRQDAPYEVLKNHWMTPHELISIKAVEQCVEKYYNTHRFIFSLTALWRAFNGDLFQLFFRLGVFISEQYSGLQSAAGDYEILMAFARRYNLDNPLFTNGLRLDYTSHYASPTSFFSPETQKLTEASHSVLRQLAFQEKVLAVDLTEPLPVKTILKLGQLVTFTMDLDAFQTGEAGQLGSHLYFVKKTKNSKHAVPQYTYLKV